MTRQEIDRRKELFGITPDDEALLLRARETVAARIDSIVDTFYRNQLAVPEIERLIGDAGTLARLRTHQSRYVLDLFGGVYDEDYVLSRLRVGLVHNRIGVLPKLYVCSVRTLLDILREHLAGTLPEGLCGACQPLLTALEKVLLFDLSLVFETYVHALVSQVERGKAELQAYAQGLEQEVARRTRQLEEQASHDPLTGLANRRMLLETLRREIAHATRHKHPLTLAYLDLDGFKGINDNFGHEEGDRILVLLAESLRSILRTEDLPARLGGDEFCAVLPGVDLAQAREVMHRLFTAFDARLSPRDRETLAVTISAGLAGLDMDAPQTAETLAKQADKAMYRAKKIPGHAVETLPFLESGQK